MASEVAIIDVSGESQQATLVIGDVRRFEVTDDNFYDIQVTLNNIVDDKANLTIKSIYEEVTEETLKEEKEKEKKAGEIWEKPFYFKYIYVGLAVIIIAIIFYIYLKRLRVRRKRKNR